MSGSYVVLARKYRPQTFEEVVGQNAVSQTLLNAIEAGRVAHAYIFSGPRGVGKTTTARILAKCLNCVKGPTKTPCNTCDACVSISQSNSTDDVLEIDGASNRGIEQIRELRESAKYVPARSRYRIFIIDEAHQITKDAFGALLKTLEEPPPHVVFMMATTEVQKIPAPILSRCQRFGLRPISAEFVFKHLKSICEKEKIKVADEALADVVRFVEGSLRDALSLLDQAVVFSPDGITSNTIRDLLGLLPLDMIRGIAKVIQNGDPVSILRAVNEAVQNGIDLTQLGKDLQGYYHNIMLAKAGVEDAFKVNSKEFGQDGANFDFGVLERNIRLLSRSLDDMRHSETPRAIFEIYALRLGQKTLDPKQFIERLEKLEKSAPAAAAAPAPSPFQRAPAPAYQASVPAARPPMQAMERPVAAAPTPPPPPQFQASSSPAGVEEVHSAWPEFVSEVAKAKASLGSALEQSRLKTVPGGLSLTFDKAFNHEMATRSIEILKGFFTKKFGAWIPIELILDKTPLPAAVPAAAGAAANPEPAPRNSLDRNRNAENPLQDDFEDVSPDQVTPDVQKALKHFPGAIKRERKTTGS